MEGRKGKILFVDDDEGVLFAAEILLKRQVDLIRTESQPGKLPEILQSERFDAIFLDMNFTGGTTSGREGFEWLQRIREIDSEAVVILMTAFGDVEMAVQAIKQGAADFILKPWQNDKLVAAVEGAVQRGQMRRAASGSNKTVEESLQQELEYASEVQQRLFPQNPPRLQTLDYWAVCKAARGVGGDYYDFIDLGNDRMGMALGDVSGKGVSAALLMASLQGCLQSYAPQHGESVDTLIADVNRLITTSTDASRFITFFYGLYDDYRRRLTYVNAGHVPPMLFRKSPRSNGVERLGAGGMVIGVLPDTRYQKATAQLEAGDLLVLFTDGISEAMNASEEEFGEERLSRLVQQNLDLPLRDMTSLILQEIDRFADNAALRDDLTLIVARVK
ncbi:MAG: SpoIIE family protein phosphatase [Acidobacteriota bacterium]